jgi:hypothetical protein
MLLLYLRARLLLLRYAECIKGGRRAVKILKNNETVQNPATRRISLLRRVLRGVTDSSVRQEEKYRKLTKPETHNKDKDLLY